MILTIILPTMLFVFLIYLIKGLKIGSNSYMESGVI